MIVFGYFIKNKSNKRKNKQVGLHQTKKLLDSKGDHQQCEKTTCEMEENMSANHTSVKGLVSKIYKESTQFNSKKTQNNLILK